ncbi:hypothetical protein [Dyadobacter sp. Leaf189]|uniref:hypothetical protein n=1 Tax=Dyadobacter sp. Leaf189 TaxID=1736295 RepID=UPI0006F51197|nr:hypothetical protein [Dyadobacter sp. Leaf189]KQS23793.1 hypothetical protein ASG33_24535 [Dyadobacter sp. Leaf189]
MKKIEYSDILHEHVYLYYKGDRHYPVSIISDQDRWLADWVKCTRYYVQGSFGESYNDLLAEALQDLRSVLFDEVAGFKYLVLMNTQRVEPLDATNFCTLASHLVDSRNALIVIAGEDLLKDVQNVPVEYDKATGSGNIDYLRLILDLCPLGASVCKMSGDGGDDYIAFDLFSKNK